MKRIMYTLTVLSFILAACNGNRGEDGAQQNPDKTAQVYRPKPKTTPKPVKEAPLDEETLKNQQRLIPHEKTLEGLTFRYGYTKYDEDKYGFENPGFLEVKKDGKLLFKDAFKGEGEPFVTSAGYHELGGKKLIFKLNYGTPACDYAQISRYYVVNTDGSVSFITESWSANSGDGYSTRSFREILPGDTTGEPNTMVVIESLVFHEGDKPDQADTTRIIFSGNTFRVEKNSDNIAKAE